ncbi:hypothetical protein EV1_003053 [Malus domestica]
MATTGVHRFFAQIRPPLDRGALVQSLIDTVNEIASISDYKCTVKKQYCNLAMRLKLLTPMFEEIRDSKEVVSRETLKALLSFMEALELANELLRFESESSKIYLVLEREQIMMKFYEVTARLEQALSGISFENLDISDEVKEHVELILARFRRAKGRFDSPSVELDKVLENGVRKRMFSSSDSTAYSFSTMGAIAMA